LPDYDAKLDENEALESRVYLRPPLAARLRERSAFGDRDPRDWKAETRGARGIHSPPIGVERRRRGQQRRER
jgi:hypothetical protein